jgi:hypothetical protein
MREEHQARLEARHQAAAQPELTARQAKSMEQMQQEGRSAWQRYKDAHPQLDPEVIRQKSAEAWQRYRDAHHDPSSTVTASTEPPPLGLNRSRDDDYSL